MLPQMASAAVAASVAAGSRRCRRLLAAGVMGGGVIEKWQERVTSCCPVAWRMATQAFSPARTHRSYRATKSSLAIFSGVDDGCCGGHLAHAPSRTMLAHVGLAQESWGSAGRLENCCQVSHPLSDLLSTPKEGEAGRQGEGRTGVGPACLYLPSTPTEGEGGGGEAVAGETS